MVNRLNITENMSVDWFIVLGHVRSSRCDVINCCTSHQAPPPPHIKTYIEIEKEWEVWECIKVYLYGVAWTWNHVRTAKCKVNIKDLAGVERENYESFELFKHRQCECNCSTVCVCAVCVLLHVCFCCFVWVPVCKRQRELCAGLCQSLLAEVDVFVSACLSLSLSVHPH